MKTYVAGATSLIITFLKKGKKKGIKYMRNLKHLEKINVLN